MTVKPRASYVRLTPDSRRAALIEAALRCISEGGIAAFTVDRVCAKAGVSRGLVTHHFGTMNALLTAVYGHLHTSSLPNPADLDREKPQILALLDHFFAPAAFNRQALNTWLTFWAEIPNHPALRDNHRTQYPALREMVTTALLQSAPELPGPEDLATTLICLIDGLSLQHCIDPDSMPVAFARQTCIDLLVGRIPALA